MPRILHSRIAQVLFVAGVIILAVQGLNTKPQPVSPFEMQTEHIAVLSPHMHGQGDSAEDSTHHVTVNSQVEIAPRDMYISKIKFEMVNAPNVVLHHASFVDLSQPNQTCPNFPHWRELFVYGSDRMYDNALTFPKGYALFIKKGTPLKLQLMVHNPEPPLGPGETYKDVYTRIVLTESSEPARSLSLLEPYLLHLDDKSCGFTEPDASDVYTFAVPAHTRRYVFKGHGSDDQSSTKVFSKPATIVHLAGHLHGWQGAKQLVIYKNGQAMHTFDIIPSTTSPFIYETRHTAAPYHMNAGDKLSISALYENDHAVSARGVMGIVGFYYVDDH